MLRRAKPILLGAALLAGVAAPAAAADFYEPPVVEAPPVYYQPQPEPASPFGGWYIRGDIDYHKLGWRGGDYILYTGPASGTTGSFDTGDIRGSFSLGGGIGFQASKHFRFDLTGDYFFRSAFRGTTSGTTGCGGLTYCVDESSVSAFLLLANAYAELGTWGKVTPYIGAGLGGAYVKWDDLRNTTIGGGTTTHVGAANWRFAWALMAGASYCLTDKLKLDVGYRFTRISGGRMFGQTMPGGAFAGSGPGYDRGFNVHEGRAGLRYQFGGGSGCGYKKEFVSYEPEPIVPVYK